MSGQQEYVINPYHKANVAKIIAVRGSNSFGDVARSSQQDSDSDRTIEFTSSKDAIITIDSQSFTVKISSQEYTDVFSLVEEDDSLNFIGMATKRGVIMNMSSRELANRVKPIGMQSVPKQTMEVMSMSKVLSANNAVHSHRLNTSTFSSQPPTISSSLKESPKCSTTTDKEENLPIHKKQKMDPKFALPSTLLNRQTSSTGRQVTDPAEIAPQSLFVKISGLPLDVKLSDIRNLISPLKFACFHLCPKPSLKSFDAFVVFESNHGAALALQRSGEIIHFRNSTIGKSDMIASRIGNVSRLEATWAAHTSLWFDNSSSSFAKLTFWQPFYKIIDESSFSSCPLCSFLENEQCSKDWMDIYNSLNSFSEVVDDNAFASLIMDTVDSKNLPSNELIIQNALYSLLNHSSPRDGMSELEIHMHGLAMLIIAAKKLSLLFESDSTFEISTLQIIISWTKRIQRLLEALYILFWKINLLQKVEILE